MILDKTVIMRWNSNNKKYYENLGYIFTKYKDEFEIKVEHLPPHSHYKINCKCDICGKENKLNYHNYIKRTNNLIEKYYCKKCCIIKIKNNNFNKYGLTNC
jgi:hypothetical protein